jgi:hypothetical protein
MNVQLARLSIFDRDRENLRLQPRSVACLTRDTPHKSADAIACKLALRFLIKALHLRHQSFERPLVLTVAPEFHLDRLIARAEVKRFLERLWQLSEGHVLIDSKMLYERALQIAVVSLHPFRAAPPRVDRTFRDRFSRIGDH